MKSPFPQAVRRRMADNSASGISRLAGMKFWVSVRAARCGAPFASPLAHLDHTPSPLGQRGVAPPVLPPFFGHVGSGGNDHRFAAPAWEHNERFRVGPAHKSSQENRSCLSKTQFASSLPALALRPAATQLPNKASVARPSARALRPSPAAASCKARPLVRPVTSPIASLIPTNVTDPTPRRAFWRGPRNNAPRSFRCGGAFAFSPRPRKTAHVQ